MDNLKRLLREFLEYLEIERGRSMKTVENYHHYLQVFFTNAGIKQLRDMSKDRVRQFRLHLNRRGLKANTQNYYLIALRTFLKYLTGQGLVALSPAAIDLAKTSRPELELLNNEELACFLKAPDMATAR